MERAEGVATLLESRDICSEPVADPRLLALLQLTNDCVISIDAHGCVELMNASAARLTGWTESEARGQPVERVVRIADGDPKTPEGKLLRALWQGEERRSNVNQVLISRDGVAHRIEVATAPIGDEEGGAAGRMLVLRTLRGVRLEQPEPRSVEAELRKANRALHTLSECNQALVRAVDEASLLDTICQLVVEVGGYDLAWVGYKEYDDAKSVRPVSQSGCEREYLETLQISWADNEQGRGPTGVAIRVGLPSWVRNVRTDSDFAPWRLDATQRGYASSLAVPLTAAGETLGALSIYSVEPDAFDPDEIALLTELASDLAFGIAGHRTRLARERAEAERQAAQQRFEDIVEFLPDATFVIDQDKKLIAWNHACETMTGVTKESLLGQGDYAYAEPFFRQRHPILIDLLDLSRSVVEANYKYVRREGRVLYAESFIQHLRKGEGAHLWGVAAPLFDRDGNRCGAIEVIRDVTEQKLVERALQQSELKHRSLFETANDAILLMREDRFIDCNARALAMYGCTREQLVGASPYDFSPPNQSDGARSDAKALAKVGLALTQGPQYFEWEHRRRDGTCFIAEVSLNRLDLDDTPVLQAIVRDVSERKRAEAALRKSEGELTTILDNVSDVIFAVSAEPNDGYRFTSVNRRFLETTGLSKDQILGVLVRDVIPEPARAMVLRNYNEAVRSGSPGRWEEVSEYPAGTKVGHVTVVPVFDAAGKCTQLVGMVHDITERQQAEARVKELNEDLKRHAESLELRVQQRTAELVLARDQAQSADRFKSAFLATMSHELRTPLNSILGFSGILRQGLAGPLNQEQSKQMGMVCSSAEHLLALINDVLDLSKIEAGELLLANEPFDLRASVNAVLEAARPLADKKRLALVGDLPAEPIVISSDHRRVEQIVLNLLSNAIKFTDTGRVSVKVSVSDVRLTIAVTDTGMGLKREDLGNLFKPFTQIDSGINRRHEGTGLGLSICKKLVELLGGSIWVKSEWGKGSTFGFDLPMDRGGR